MVSKSVVLLFSLITTIILHHHKKYHVVAFHIFRLQHYDSYCTFPISRCDTTYNIPTSTCYYANGNNNNNNGDSKQPSKGSTRRRSRRCGRCSSRCRSLVLLESSSSPSDVEAEDGKDDDDDDLSFTAAESDDDDDVTPEVEATPQDQFTTSRNKLKMELFQYGASYDRGFGATPSSRSKVDTLIQALEALNTEDNASSYADDSSSSSLLGNWRLIWATGPDVLSLAGNPFITVGAIYQLFTNPPIVTNVIDVLPRAQALLPPSIVPNSILRLKVQTRAYRYKKGDPKYPNRIGLDFESVEIEPIEFLGQDVSKLLPPLGFDLPKIMEIAEDVGYFDVSYLDNQMLIIRQNQPGGLFVLTKVDNSDP